MVEFAFGADGAAVGQHDVFGDGQAEASTAGFAGAGFVDAIEAFEQSRQVLGGDAGAEILNKEFNTANCGTRAQNNAPAGTAVFHGVVNEIGKHLMNCFAVGTHGR